MRTAISSLLLLIAVAPASRGATIQDLTDIVPASAHLMVQGVTQPEMAFADAYVLEVLEAICDARFDEMIVEIMESAGADQGDINEFRQARDMIITLVGSVDWLELMEKEVVFAQRVEPALPGTLMPSMIVAFKPNAEEIESHERSLSALLATLGGLAPEELSYEIVPTDEGAPRLYKLKIRALRDASMVQMAVDDTRIVIGMGDGLFSDSVELMSDGDIGRIANSPRYRMAMADVPPNCSQVTYVDMKGMLGGYRDGLLELLIPRGISDTGKSIVNDVHGLVSCVDTIAESVHAEGTTIVTQSWVRYDEDAAAAGNPILAGMRASEASDQLLEFVPYNATSFAVHDGFDLAPLYRWGLERYNSYVPDADKHMIAWNGIQAAFDMNVEKDVLSWLGSPGVMVTLPPAKQGFGQSDEWVAVTLLDDPRSAKKCVARFEAVFDAVIPPALEAIRKEARGAPIPDISIEGLDRPGGLRKIRIQMAAPIPIPPIIYGMMGSLLVFASSEEALEHVMGTAAGEIAGLYDHVLPTLPGELPEGPVVSAGLIPWGQHMRQLNDGLLMADGLVKTIIPAMVSSQHGSAQKEGMLIATVATGLLSRIRGILEHIDFMDHGVHSTVARDGGMTHYRRSATVLLSPEQRQQQQVARGR